LTIHFAIHTHKSRHKTTIQWEETKYQLRLKLVDDSDVNKHIKVSDNDKMGSSNPIMAALGDMVLQPLSP